MFLLRWSYYSSATGQRREVWVVTQQHTLLRAAQVALLYVCASHQRLCQAAERRWLKCAIMGVWAWNNLCTGSVTRPRSSASYWLTPAFVFLLKAGWDARELIFYLWCFCSKRKIFTSAYLCLKWMLYYGILPFFFFFPEMQSWTNQWILVYIPSHTMPDT